MYMIDIKELFSTLRRKRRMTICIKSAFIFRGVNVATHKEMLIKLRAGNCHQQGGETTIKLATSSLGEEICGS